MNGHAMAGKLADETAVVPVAARGLCRTYALQLGAHVVVVDIRLDAAREFSEALTDQSVTAEIERLDQRSIAIQADLAQHADAVGAIRKAHEAFERIDIPVNNAGAALTPAKRSRASETPEQDTRFLLDINYMSAVHCCQAAAAIVKTQRSGIIVNISSQSALPPISKVCSPPTPPPRRHSPISSGISLPNWDPTASGPIVSPAHHDDFACRSPNRLATHRHQ